jgi:hypothetical protein
MATDTKQYKENERDLLTEFQAREQELPMSLGWFRQRRLRGGGPPYIRIANRVFYRRGDLRRWILDQIIPSAATDSRGVGRRENVIAREVAERTSRTSPSGGNR